MTRRNKVSTIISIILVIVIFSWFINMLLIFPWKDNDLIYQNKIYHSDMIVFLEGEDRMNQALKLYGQGYSNLIFNPGGITREYRVLVSEKMKAHKVVNYFEGNGAKSTYQEALGTKKFAGKKHIHSLILVTSTYHSFRAYWIFKKVMPNINIISSPMEPTVDINVYKNKMFEQEKIKFFYYYLMYSWRIY